VASRAEAGEREGSPPGGVPPPPRIRGALRAAASEFYFNSWRLVPANILWTLVLGLSYLAFLAWPIWLIVTVPLLALPTAGIYRLGTLIARSEPVAFSDALSAPRRGLLRIVCAGALISLVSVVLVADIVLGMEMASPIGWSLATLSMWALLVLCAGVLIFWPLLLDPEREDRPLRATVRLTALLLLAFPLRFAALAMVTGAIIVVSTVAAAALATVAISFVALVGTHYVLPAADRLEARLAGRLATN